jgi:hypothetical protein
LSRFSKIIAAIEANWRDCATRSEKVFASQYVQQHADFLRDLVCNADGYRQEIADGIIVWLSNDLYYHSDPASRLARDLLGLGSKKCAATEDLSERTKKRLRELASTPTSAN